MDRKENTIGVFLDLSKAFDTVNHNIMLRKLEFYGIRGIALQWVKHYLSGRKQYVMYNNTQSSMQYITCGIPQGSVLGPLLFLIYINDIPKCLKQPFRSQVTKIKTPRLLKKSSKNRSSVGTVSFLILMILLFTSYYYKLFFLIR